VINAQLYGDFKKDERENAVKSGKKFDGMELVCYDINTVPNRVE
jgi:hypothetical protein